MKTEDSYSRLEGLKSMLPSKQNFKAAAKSGLLTFVLYIAIEFAFTQTSERIPIQDINLASQERYQELNKKVSVLSRDDGQQFLVISRMFDARKAVRAGLILGISVFLVSLAYRTPKSEPAVSGQRR